jgi:hypothetical protein
MTRGFLALSRLCNNAGDGGGPLVPGRSQEAMAPEERGLQAHVAALGRLTQPDAVDEGAGVAEPGVAAMQLRERRAGQRVERAMAVAALVAAQAARLPQGAEAFGAAMSAGRGSSKARLNQRHSLVGRPLASERRQQCSPLHLGQITQLLDKTTKILGFHGILSPVRIARGVSPYIKSKQSHGHDHHYDVLHSHLERS